MEEEEGMQGRKRKWSDGLLKNLLALVVDPSPGGRRTLGLQYEETLPLARLFDPSPVSDTSRCFSSSTSVFRVVKKVPKFKERRRWMVGLVYVLH